MNSISGIPNINPNTGIPYGVVSLNSLQDWVFDEFSHNGVNLTYEAALEEAQLEKEFDEEEFNETYSMVVAEEEEFELEMEPEGLKLLLGYLGGAPLVWVLESPHTAKVRECSPCVPNAGDLDSKGEGSVLCYTLPPEWFREEETDNAVQ